MDNVNYNLVNVSRKIKKGCRLTPQQAYEAFIRMLQNDLKKTRERYKRDRKDG